MAKGFIRDKIVKGYAGLLISKLAKEELAKRAEAKRLAEPPVEPDFASVWKPNSEPQAQFFNSTCQEVLYGGAAGGGKSAALTALLLRFSHLESFNGVILRRDTSQFKDLFDKSKALFPLVYKGLEPVHTPHFVWNFPAGGTANYRHCQHEKDIGKFDGWEINLLGFDELTHFTKKQYLGLCARVRSSKKHLPTLIRATTNPGGEGHDWVFERWGAWLNPEFKAIGVEPRFAADGATKLPPAKPGEVWWIRTVDGVEHYYREDPGFPSNPAQSRTFIPASLYDNPDLALNDPSYEARIQAMDPVRREQLLSGNWLIQPSAGLYFSRTWVEFIDEAPQTGVLARCRAWDLASTKVTDATPNPDWTSGTLMAWTKTSVIIEDQVRAREDPGGVKELIRATANTDTKRVAISLPQDPAQAGKSQAHDFAVWLRGWRVFFRRPSGDKITRFGPFSAYAKPTGDVKKVFIVRGPWNKAFLEELEAFPTPGVKDDQVDSTSDAFNTISDNLRQPKPTGKLEVINESDRS